MARQRRRDGVERCLARIPLYFSYTILITTWILFMLFITLGEVLIRRREVGRFLEQIVIYNGLLFMTLLSLYTTSHRSPGSPDQSLAPPLARPPVAPSPLPDFSPPSSNRHRTISHSEGDAENGEIHEDDVPLRYLRNSNWTSKRWEKDRPSPLPLRSGVRYPPDAPKRSPSPTNLSSHTASTERSDFSPFPLSANPLLPHSAEETGEDDSQERIIHVTDEALGDTEENTSLLPKENGDVRVSLMAKGSNGGARWCKKCDGWKPDRCHHCRQCDRCVLKMDHHCPWVGSCVGYHNYKSFLLFITYGTLLAIYSVFETSYETYRFFSDPDAAVSHRRPSNSNSTVLDDAKNAHMSDWSNDIGLSPAVFMMLTILGVFIGLSLGGLACFHWWLAAHNQTTLENITHSYPSALLDLPSPHSPSSPSSSSPQPGDRNTSSSRQSYPEPGRWKPDHMLTRRERERLRHDAKEINVYDLGWRKNLRRVFFGEEEVGVWGILAALWPRAGRSRDARAGHYFEFDAKAFEKLKAVTIELRYGAVKDELEDSDTEESEDEDGWEGDGDGGVASKDRDGGDRV
ncbi:hypothetical protein L202_03269 [Cryptococcus amylolentus CBS 6039]|uniref:Palmitoyltransferase n=1 Tax=Cryptococcus amylolentus CBS 6039 TaxID=1295533 RepID=A0A1E3HSD1_9TREE|nr:hypothetical protein L202_03269 [Cryptococcus amylolentus CBS 6039]ODN79254.1 hypothetical protein L202_03269 [Cryptococcus amylolentus CBS 6039]